MDITSGIMQSITPGFRYSGLKPYYLRALMNPGLAPPLKLRQHDESPGFQKTHPFLITIGAFSGGELYGISQY
jgi:hypothetical protein